MIRRLPEQATKEAYDLIVVGGGIQGTALALEAARRGLRPLLIERVDFGSQTSWNSLRIVHGGLRYLQTMDLARFRESVRERRWFLECFPDLVRPLPCLMPLYGLGLHRPAVLRAVLAIEDRLSTHRNDGIRTDRHLRPGRVLSVAETVERFPEVRRQGLRGGALWWDASMPDSQRVLIAMLRWAVERGATALNYVEAQGPIVDHGRLCGVAAREVSTGARLEFRAPTVVLCGGPWNDVLASKFGVPARRPTHMMLAFNALLDLQPGFDVAIAVSSGSHRSHTYFAYPGDRGLLAGTYQASWKDGPDVGPPGPELMQAFLEDLRAAVPALGVRKTHVVRTYWGLLPARAKSSVRLTTRPMVVRHATHGGPAGLYSVTGIKFTTSRLVAERVLRLIHSDLARPFPGYSGAGPPDIVHPPSLPALRDLWSREPDRARTLIRTLVETEAVVQTDDLVLRRTDWGHRPADIDALEPSLRKLLRA